MKTFDFLRTIASENNLTMVETTSEASGYPAALQYALIGLNDFDQARELAREYDMRIVELRKRDGQQLYSRGNELFEPLRPTAADYGDDYSMIDGGIDEDEYYEDFVLSMLGEQNSLRELEEFTKMHKEVSEELSVADESQWIITLNGRYYETIDKEATEWSFDTRHHIIALI